MSIIYIVRVFEDEDIYEYEFGNIIHAQRLSDQEKAYNEIWTYDTVYDEWELYSISE